MTLTKGSRLGPYEVLDPLGAGGMGEVYRAKDTRLDREVAVKVLPADLAANPDFKQRFEREAKTISSLSHPHICALYDVGHEDGVDFLVMELLEGETLAERLKRGPLPAEQVQKTGIQMAEALDGAHRRGLIHRDLKPGNIMLTPSGAKLMDFGLAKPGVAPQGGSSLTAMPTQTTPLTAEGTLVGTFQYMSPEQIEGKEADVRSDIFALGAVLYEMATGKRAFEGKSQISVMASILEKDPPSMSELQPMTPPALERLIRTCLAKDPEARLQSARDVALQLQWIGEAGSQVGAPSGGSASRKGRSRWVWAFAVVCLAIAAGSSIAWHRAASFHPMSVRASILPPKKMAFDFSPTRGGPVLSPDGTRLVYPVTAPSGRSTLWVRRLDSLTGQPLEGTEGASYPFWSPDSRHVAFFVDGKLEKIDAGGGPPQVLCDAPNGRGGSWSRKGEIIFAPDIFSGLDKVPSSGGAPAAVTRLDNSKDQASQRWPCFLPDGEHFLFWAGSWIGNTRTAGARHNGIYVGSLDGTAPKFLFKCDSDARYAPPGYLLYLKQRTLMARAFNADHLAFDGVAFPLDSDLAYSLDYRLGLFSAARGGMLVYQVTTNTGMQAAWMNTSTGAIQPVGRFGQIQGLRLSPDGRRLAETIYAAKTGNADIWITDLTRGVSTRLTFNPAADAVPTWSPDGRRIAFSSDRKNGHDMGIYVKEASGVGDAKVLVAPKKGVEDYVTDWSRDGRFLTFTRLLPFAKDKQAELCLLRLTGKKRTVTVLTKTPFGGGNGVFSPEGRWLAFSSKGTGQMEVYLTTYPVPEGRWQISQGGGANPRWSRDGKTLYYRARGGKVMAVSLTLGKDTVTAGVPRMVAQLPFSEFQQPYWIYDVGPEGKRVMVLRPGAGGTIPLTLVTHWTAGIKK